MPAESGPASPDAGRWRRSATCGTSCWRRTPQTVRGYHDTRHLAEVLDRLADLGCDSVVVRLAAWFHDAVYDAAPGDEERSAQWAERALPPSWPARSPGWCG